jgi:hypothetical protein
MCIYFIKHKTTARLSSKSATEEKPQSILYSNHERNPNLIEAPNVSEEQITRDI